MAFEDVAMLFGSSSWNIVISTPKRVKITNDLLRDSNHKVVTVSAHT